MWGGPLRVLMTHDADPASDIVCFCDVVARDPFFVIGREPRPNFRPADLAAVRIGTVSEVPTPWLCLQDDIRRDGIDPASVARVTTGTMARERRRAAGGDAGRGATVPAIRRGPAGLRRRPPVVRRGQPWPDGLHHPRDPPLRHSRQTRRTARHGAGDAPHAALDQGHAGRGNPACPGQLFPGRAAGPLCRGHRPLPCPGTLWSRSRHKTGRLSTGWPPACGPAALCGAMCHSPSAWTTAWPSRRLAWA